MSEELPKWRIATWIELKQIEVRTYIHESSVWGYESFRLEDGLEYESFMEMLKRAAVIVGWEE